MSLPSFSPQNSDDDFSQVSEHEQQEALEMSRLRTESFSDDDSQALTSGQPQDDTQELTQEVVDLPGNPPETTAQASAPTSRRGRGSVATRGKKQVTAKKPRKRLFLLNASQEENFIDYMKGHPMLWDNKHAKYKDRDARLV